MQIYPPRRVRRRPPATPSAGLDRFALGFAIFSAFTFFGTLAMLCAVFTLAALLVRNDLRWGQLGGLAAVAPESPLVIFESPLPTPTPEPTATPTDTATPEPIGAPPEVMYETATPVEVPATVEPAAPIEAFETETPPPPPSFPPLDPSGSDYVAQATNHVGSMLATLNQLAVLLSAPQLMDANWQAQVDSQVAIVHNETNALGALQPSPDLAPFHSNAVAASAECLGSLFTIEQAIRYNYQDRLQTGLEQLNNCQPALANINSQLVSGAYGGNGP